MPKATRPSAESTTTRASLIVTRQPDGRYCVVYTDGVVSRRSYTPSLEQIIRQAVRAGRIPISTDDGALRQRCLEVELPLI